MYIKKLEYNFCFVYCAGTAYPENLIMAFDYSIFVKGDHNNREIEPSVGLEATELYPDIKYTTVDDYLNQFI